MNILIDRLPQEVTVNGETFTINTDFRVGIMYELLMLDEDVPKEEKPLIALNLYYGKIPAIDIEKALEAVNWFYSCGKELTTTIKSSKKSYYGDKQIYSFEYDDIYIFSAFWEQYGIDLSLADNLHWWKFKALFSSLNDDCMLRKIMSYRAIEINDKMMGEQKEFYRKMKELYKIPLSKNEQEKLSAIEKELLNGGDLSKIL